MFLSFFYSKTILLFWKSDAQDDFEIEGDNTLFVRVWPTTENEFPCLGAQLSNFDDILFMRRDSGTYEREILQLSI